MYFLYNLSVLVAGFFLQIIALFNKKLKLFVDGRKSIFQQLESDISNSDKTIWIHCASLGEFEQGRPIIEKLKTQFPNHKIVLSFFSPSGFEVRKNYEGADIICYLPLDSKHNVHKFLNLVHPELAIFVKYEFWPNYLKELKNRGIKTILVSGIFRKRQPFFKANGSWMRKSLQTFDHFFVQDSNSKELLSSIDIENVSVSGDTRFDRVWEITKQNNSLKFVEEFKDENLLLVAGSTWKDGEEKLVDYINTSTIENTKFLIAPHNINPKGIEELKNSLNKTVVLYSELEKADLSKATVFIADTIGILTKIYSYADIAYVGGGFATGLHNVLEPATFGVPVIIGPQFDKFREAKELVEAKGCLVVKDSEQMKEQFNKLLSDIDYRKSTGDICTSYVKNNIGATEMVMNYISKSVEV
ncbi:MAG: 3-deoxy-D-manno-octulosonic acid transferase [Bacteroidetes bacterium MedPE-SWsnd-G1]|nr:MAG: 3-deoxy-D-manno-octulosonic acid transferase [Bacteroidetes bacterium MedPE-SWsnd-G1]